MSDTSSPTLKAPGVPLTLEGWDAEIDAHCAAVVDLVCSKVLTDRRAAVAMVSAAGRMVWDSVLDPSSEIATIRALSLRVGTRDGSKVDIAGASEVCANWQHVRIERMLPRTWIDALNNSGPLKIRAAGAGEPESSYFKPTNTIIWTGDGSSAVHEIGHAVHLHVPVISRLVLAWFWDRVRGVTPTWDEGSECMVYPAGFTYPYVGAVAGEGDNQGVEALSTGIEILWAGTYGGFVDCPARAADGLSVAADVDHRDFIVGLLALAPLAADVLAGSIAGASV
jgi:hypothetical protein